MKACQLFKIGDYRTVEVEKPVLSGAALGKGKGGSPLDALKK